MAISASSIAGSSTLNELRTQFNNLVTDVTAISGATISYTTLNTTNTNTTVLNVKEDGTIVFEGATDDGFETTITVVDPTADRVITFPNETGTVHTSGGNIVIPDAGTLGSASSTGAIAIASSGIVTFVDDILIKDGGTIGSASSTSAITIASTGIVSFVDDIIIKDGGTIGSTSDVDAITIAADGDTTFSQDVIITGDLTISGDDLIMGTNTDGHILVADGTNFNPKAVTDLSAITSIASGDTFLAVDASGGGLKKVARSVVVSGLATSAAISDILEDTTPQLGGNLDTNSQNILIDDAHFLGDENGNEQLVFQTTGSAVNQFEMTNAATDDGSTFLQGPILQATGGDSNIDLNLIAKGTGVIAVRGNSASGAVQLNCESNSHGQILQGQPHSAGVTNTMLLPAGANSTLVSLVSTDTLTNKTLTSPVINTGTFGTSILPTSADGTTLGSATKEFSDLFLADSSTIQFGNDQEVILTHVPDVGLKLSHEATGDNLPIVLNLESEEDDIVSGEEIGRIDFTAGDSGGTDAITTAASIAATAEDTFASDNNSTGLAFKLGVSAAATEMFRMTHDGDFKIITDGSALGFGADNEIELTHVHNTGLLLTDSGGTPTLQLHDSNESVSSDGTNLFLTSGGTAFTVPASDGSNGQFLKTNGSGVLAFDTVSTVGAFNAFEYTATAAQTSFSGSDDNSNTLAYTASVNNVFVTVNGVMLDGSDYTATNGTAVVLSAAAAANDIIKILATNASSITTADLDGAEFVLDADGDTSIRANTDDQIDIKIANAIDFRMTANSFNALSGSSIVVDSGATLTLNGTAGTGLVGKQTMWVPATAMAPTVSNGCSAITAVETTSGRPDLQVLDFDKDSDEFAQFSVAFPKLWNAGTVTFQVYWAGIAATSDVDWMVDAVAVSNNTTIDVAYGTAIVVTDNAQGAVEELNVSAESGAVTIAGSPGDDEVVFFRIGRDVSGDAMAGDARLLGVKIFFTTDALTDA